MYPSLVHYCAREVVSRNNINGSDPVPQGAGDSKSLDFTIDFRILTFDFWITDWVSIRSLCREIGPSTRLRV